MNYLNPHGENRPLPSKLTMTIRRGDVFRHEVAGAGGWGDPLERNPAMVLRDVRNELVSLAAARADYGVVLAGEPLAVDEAATRALREALCRRRNWQGTPAISWEPPSIAMAAAPTLILPRPHPPPRAGEGREGAKRGREGEGAIGERETLPA
jgi:N-methylhydantoinase B